MASTGNQNNSNQQTPFNMNNVFNPSNLHPQNPSNLVTSSGLPPSSYGTNSTSPNPSATYPPPTDPYSYPAQTPPHYQSSFPHQDQSSNLQHQWSASFPTPPLHPTPSAPPSDPSHGARLMAILSNPASNLESSHQPLTSLPPIQVPSSGPIAPSIVAEPIHAMNAVNSQPPLPRMPSSKIPSGRHLLGEHVVYDVDVRLPGEVQPQLEVTPITKYGSDPGLILGRQISVNKTYICYGLKLGNIRILNINTALRSLLRGHTQRVTDMAFFAEDVHLLASASIEGRVCVWKISEGPDEEDKPQISGNVVTALTIVGEEESVHPRVCWHCHKQEILIVAIGTSVLRIDTTKVGKGKDFTADEPLQCSLDKLIDGVQFVGKHEGEVTDLSMCQWMTTRLVSASKDGTIKIWEDRKAHPLVVLKPHDGHPVGAAIFLTAAHSPEHIVLVTAGPQNRQVKLWVSSSEEGWLLPSDAESWRCVQTLELKSSSEPHIEDAFFNQVIGLSKVGLVLLANAKKNAIYVVHLDYNANPASTRMDHLAEFTVTMPILSFTGLSDILAHGEHIVQVYCVQTQAIQQYALDLSQCLPTPLENNVLKKSDSNISHDAVERGPAVGPSEGSRGFDISLATSGCKSSTQNVPETLEIKQAVSSTSDMITIQKFFASSVESNSATSHVDLLVASSPSPSSVPHSPRLSSKVSDLCIDQAAADCSVDRQIDNVQTKLHSVPSTDSDCKLVQADANPSVFKRPTHLVTPSEIMATSSAEATRLSEEKKGQVETKLQDVIVNTNFGDAESKVKVVGEAGAVPDSWSSSQGEPQTVMDRKEKAFCSQASQLGAETSRELKRDCCALPTETSIVEEAQDGSKEALDQSSNSGKQEANEDLGNLSGPSTELGASASVAQPSVPTGKGKKQKIKTFPASDVPSLSSGVYNSACLINEPGTGSSGPSIEFAVPQIAAMQEMLNQVVSSQKEMQKQMTAVVAASSKEGRRLEVALGRSMEKAAKANADALWARIQEDNAKHEKLLREQVQKIIGLITNSFNKDLLTNLDKVLKKELSTVSTNIARTITPLIEKTTSSAISDSFQRGVGDKAVNQLERSVTSKIESTIARQMHTQFQSSGKQAIQEGLKSVLEANVIPAVEKSCKLMFEQVDAGFRKGMAEHAAVTQHQFESLHSPLAISLRETINSASTLSKTLSGELADGQRKLLAYASAGGSSTVVNPLVPSNGPVISLHDKVEQPVDPTKELSRLIAEHKYEEAFTSALHKTDVSIVSWLCSQVDMQRILSMNPTPLSQGVLLALLQQLACDMGNDTVKKLQWMTDVAAAINPRDPLITLHVGSICDQVYQILNHRRSQSTTSSSKISSIRVLMHVINSMLMACK